MTTQGWTYPEPLVGRVLLFAVTAVLACIAIWGRSQGYPVADPEAVPHGEPVVYRVAMPPETVLVKNCRVVVSDTLIVFALRVAENGVNVIIDECIEVTP
jgi:hypothetical protein